MALERVRCYCKRAVRKACSSWFEQLNDAIVASASINEFDSIKVIVSSKVDGHAFPIVFL